MGLIERPLAFSTLARTVRRDPCSAPSADRRAVADATATLTFSDVAGAAAAAVVVVARGVDDVGTAAEGVGAASSPVRAHGRRAHQRRQDLVCNRKRQRRTGFGGGERGLGVLQALQQQRAGAALTDVGGDDLVIGRGQRLLEIAHDLMVGGAARCRQRLPRAAGRGTADVHQGSPLARGSQQRLSLRPAGQRPGRQDRPPELGEGLGGDRRAAVGAGRLLTVSEHGSAAPVAQPGEGRRAATAQLRRRELGCEVHLHGARR